MLDIGWSELMLIGVVALIVVGPRDLPVMFRTLGRFTAKARSMAREFQRAMDDAAKSTGVHDVVKDVQSMTSKKSLGLTALENAATKFEQWNPNLPGSKPKGASPMPSLAKATPAVSIPVSENDPEAEADAVLDEAQPEAEAVPAPVPAVDPAPAPARKPRAKAAKVAEADLPAPEAKAAPKPRKPRTKKSDT